MTVHRVVYRDQTEDTLLEKMRKSGQAPPSECEAGACGTCRVLLKAGKVRYLVDDYLLWDEQHVLTCCSTAETNIVLLAF